MLVAVQSRSAQEAGLAVGRQVRLATELQTASGRQPISIVATVAWLRDGFVGIQFATPSDAIVSTLQRHDALTSGAVSDHEPIHIRRSPSKGRNEGRCLAKMRHVAQGRLPGLLRELLRQSLETLLDMAERVASDVERQQVYGDLTSLERLVKRDLLMREVMSNALNPLQEKPKQKADDDDELALVDIDDFERWLEASRAATLLERKFGDQITAIGARLAAVRDTGMPGDLSVPFEPKNFTDALKSVSLQMEFGASTRSALFDQGARVLQENLGAFYTELQQALDAAGVPQAPAPVARGPRKAHQDGAAAERPDATPEDAQDSDNAAGTEPDMTAVAEQVVAPASGGSVTSIVTGVPEAPTVTVDARALELLIERDNRQREAQAREMLSTLVQHTDNGPGMAEWLQRIDQSLVAEAVADPGFFHGNDNPLHSIIDALGHLQMFSETPYDANAHDEVRDQVNALLDPIAHGDADPEQMQEIASSFGELTREKSETYKRNVERVVEASEGRDRVRLARDAVVQELNDRYAGRQVPALLPDLIDVGWRSVLELAWLNTASDSKGYAHHLKLLDSVVAHLGGEAVSEESAAFERADLLAQVSGELETAAFDPFRRNAIETRLRDALLDSKAGKAELIEMPTEAGGAACSEEVERPAQIPLSAWQPLLDTCAGIRLGDRLQFTDGIDNGRVLYVAWIRSDRRLFTLVDHRGIKARDIGLASLAIGLHQRTIRLDQVDGRSASGRAVGQMLEEMEARLSHLASHDSLTGLMNRRQFQAAVEKAVAGPSVADECGALLWIDIDQFKLINDIHGYATGDRLLVAVSSLLERLATTEVVAHLGADRFAALLPSGTLDTAEQWGQTFCEAVRSMPFDWGGPGTTISVSIGAIGLEASTHGTGELLQAVENALAAAKLAGGDRVYAYRDDDPELLRQRESVKWLAQVDDALVDGELRLRCQPIVPVRSGDGIEPHYEVLLGVANGASEALPIAEFIEAAERYKRMRAVDRWVTKSVFEWIAANRELMPQLHGFAVNLSGQTASDPEFVDFVRQQFQRTAIDPRWVSFEVTETAAVASLSGTAGIIQELKGLGCMVALDDFGSGLASYSYLKELPVDWLKIDGVFVRDIANDREDYAVVKSINDIGHFLGKKTIAEYVKDETTLELVREIGVDLAQGFGISPPILMDELLTLATKQVQPVPAQAGKTAIKR